MAANCKACGKTISPFLKPRICAECEALSLDPSELVPSYGCHWTESFIVYRKPKNWRIVFDECRFCGRNTSEVMVANFKFRLCIPCADRAELGWRDWHEG